MSDLDIQQQNSADLAKVGFANGQDRITAIDSKVGMAAGLLGVLLPAPMVIIAWFTGLQGDTSKHILEILRAHQCWAFILGILLVAGMLCALVAIIEGITSLMPRGPKGYRKNGVFHNEWRPNILFPIYEPTKEADFCKHTQVLKGGVETSFVIDEYDHQLQQLGFILDKKFIHMRQCFRWLKYCLLSYGVAVVLAAILLLLCFATMVNAQH